MEIDWNLIMGETLTQLLKIFIPVFIALIIHWIGDFYTKLKATNPDLAQAIALAAAIGYSSAEEYFRDNLTADGKDKEDYAIEHAQDFMNELGIHVELSVIRDAIINYGVNNKLFTWQWEKLDEMIGEHIIKPIQEQPEEEKDE